MAMHQYVVCSKILPFSASFRHIRPAELFKRTLSYNHRVNGFTFKKCHPLDSRNFKLSSSVCNPWESSGLFSRAKYTSSGHSPYLYSCHNTPAWRNICVRPLKTSCTQLAFSGHQQVPPQSSPPPQHQNEQAQQASDLNKQQVENSSWVSTHSALI